MQRARSTPATPRASPTLAPMTDEIPRSGGERKARVARGAAKQWGNVTRAQLRSVGFSTREIDGMVRRGEIHRRHRGVYAWGHVSPAPEAKWAAALLAAGPGSALSHTAALAADGLVVPRGVTEVTAPTQRRGDETLRIHVSRLEEADVRVVRGLRVTTIPRTLHDMAARGWPIDRLTQDAAGRNLLPIDDIRAYAGAAKGRGARSLRDALERPHVRSGPERRLAAKLARHGLPVPEFNARVGRIRVDAYWHELAFAVELDPEQTHGTTAAAADDAWRDDYVKARGITLRRIEEADFELLAAELRRRAA